MNRNYRVKEIAFLESGQWQKLRFHLESIRNDLRGDGSFLSDSMYLYFHKGEEPDWKLGQEVGAMIS